MLRHLGGEVTMPVTDGLRLIHLDRELFVDGPVDVDLLFSFSGESRCARWRHHLVFRDGFPLCSTAELSFEVVFPLFSCSLLFVFGMCRDLHSYIEVAAARNAGNRIWMSWPALGTDREGTQEQLGTNES